MGTWSALIRETAAVNRQRLQYARICRAAIMRFGGTFAPASLESQLRLRRQQVVSDTPTHPNDGFTPPNYRIPKPSHRPIFVPIDCSRPHNSAVDMKILPSDRATSFPSVPRAAISSYGISVYWYGITVHPHPVDLAQESLQPQS